jgi:hypothetical protein
MPVDNMRLLTQMRFISREVLARAAGPFVKQRQMLFLSLVCAIAAGCNQVPVQAPDLTALSETRRIQILPNQNNTLSGILTIAGGRGVVSAEIAGDSLTDSVTPLYSVSRESAVIPILGLRPNKTYAIRVLGTPSSGTGSVSPLIPYSTSSLPDSTPRFSVLNAHSPTVRYVMLGITPAKGGGSCAVIVDVAGVPVWHKEFRDAVVDFQKQPSGRYTAWSSLGSSPSHFYEFDNLGDVKKEYSASGGLDTDPHELRMRGDNYALLGIQFRTQDLRSVGGLASASVEGFIVEYRRPGRAPLLWNIFDHFDVTDAAPDISLKGQNVDPWHANAIEIDLDGNLLVSFRNSDEITKINTETGEVMWRLGGKSNQFTFRNDNLQGFSHQHGIRRLENGHIILFDDGNLHSPPISRAVEYRLDEQAKIAELVWEYRPNPPLFGFALGFAQRLPNGNTLVCFGTAQHIIEVDKGGVKRWELLVNEPQRYAYRAFAIESLY